MVCTPQQHGPSGSIKFTHEIETDNTITFLDTLLERKEHGSVKVKVYGKKTPYQPVLGIRFPPSVTSEVGGAKNSTKQM